MLIYVLYSDIHQLVRAVQEIRFRTASSLVCATDLIKASSKRCWPPSSILGETPITNHHGVFVSYPDGLALASRLKLPTERLRDAMNKNMSRISIEIDQDEAEAIDEEESLIVHILPSRSLINATNLLAVRRCLRTRLPDLLNGGGIHGTHYRAYGMQGTYISYADGFRVCNALEFSEDRLCQIRNAIKDCWLGPLVCMQHEPKVNIEVVRSKLAQSGKDGAENAANEGTDVRKGVQLEEFLLPSAEIPSFAGSSIRNPKKLSRKGCGDNLDDRYYETLDLEDEEFELNTCDDRLDHDGSEPVTTRRRLSPTQTRTLEDEFRRNPRIDVGTRARLAKELGIEKHRISVSLFSRV